MKAINGNTVGNLTLGTTGGTMSGTVTGISTASGTTIGLSQNKVYGLTTYGTGAVTTGLAMTSSGTVTATNNLVGDLKAPAATGRWPCRASPFPGAPRLMCTLTLST